MRNQYKVLQEAYEQVLEVVGKPVSKEVEDFVVNTYKQGVAQNQLDYTDTAKLADLVGLNRNTIYDILRRHNIKPAIKNLNTVKWGQVVRANQKYPPAQINYIYQLIAKRVNDNPQGPFAYSNTAIASLVNSYIDQHPETSWIRLVNIIQPQIHSTGVNEFNPLVRDYIKKYEKEKLGYKRTEDGVMTNDGKIYQRSTLKRNKTHTRQQSHGELGKDDPSYHTATGDAQPINDTI